MQNLRQPSPLVIESGVNALDLFDSPEVSPSTFTSAVAFLQANYGAEYSQEKTSMLFDLIREENWSEERFKRTFRWFLKNKPYTAWTIADWFSYSVKIYPMEWYHNEQHKSGIYTDVRNQMDIYILPNAERGYRYRDGIILPFERVK